MWKDRVIGQSAILEKMEQTIENGRISHAQLLLGAHGRGGLVLAIAYAEMLMTKTAKDASHTQAMLDKMAHPDLHFAFPVNTSQKVAKDPKSDDYIASFRTSVLDNPYLSLFDWTKAMGIEKKQVLINKFQSAEISRKLQLKSYEGSYKVMIIWLPENMNTTSANKLLKVIEEPPEKTVLLLVAEDEDQLLTTILSRTQIIRIPPIESAAIENQLRSQFDLAPDVAKSIASLADGDFYSALNILHTSDEENYDQKAFIQWMRMCYQKDFFKIEAWVGDISRIGRGRQINFLSYGLHIFRECLVTNYADPSLVRLNGEEEGFVQKFKPFINTANALQLVDEFEEAADDVGRNGNPKIIFTDLSLKVMKLLTLKP